MTTYGYSITMLQNVSTIGFWIMIVPIVLTLMAGITNLIVAVCEYYEVDVVSVMEKILIIGVILWIIPGVIALLL